MSHLLMQQYPLTHDELLQLDKNRMDLCKEIVEKFNVKACSNQLAREGGNSMSEGAVLRLKMMVNTLKTVHGNEGQAEYQEIALSAVYSNKVDSANAQWSRWTPSASLTMQVSNTTAFNKVKPGQFVYVDITPTDKDSL